MENYRHEIMPSVFWEYHFKNINNEKLLEECYKLSENEGRKLSNVDGYQSNDIDVTKHVGTELEKLYQTMRIAFNDIAVKENAKPLDVDNFWININPKGGRNSPHTHPHSILSSSYYVKVPEGDGGNICFNRDRSLRDYTSGWLDKNNMSQHMWNAYCFKPIQGTAVIFTSNLEHSVGSNNTDELRVSIAFNSHMVIYNR